METITPDIGFTFSQPWEPAYYTRKNQRPWRWPNFYNIIVGVGKNTHKKRKTFPALSFIGPNRLQSEDAKPSLNAGCRGINFLKRCASRWCKTWCYCVASEWRCSLAWEFLTLSVASVVMQWSELTACPCSRKFRRIKILLSPKKTMLITLLTDTAAWMFFSDVKISMPPLWNVKL